MTVTVILVDTKHINGNIFLFLQMVSVTKVLICFDVLLAVGIGYCIATPDSYVSMLVLEGVNKLKEFV